MDETRAQFTLEFEGFENRTHEGLQRFKAICIADLEFSVDHTIALLSESDETRIIKTSEDLGDLSALCNQLRETGAKVAIVTPDGTTVEPEPIEASADTSGTSDPDQDSTSESDSEHHTEEFVLEWDDLVETPRPAPPKEYVLDMDAPMSLGELGIDAEIHDAPVGTPFGEPVDDGPADAASDVEDDALEASAMESVDTPLPTPLPDAAPSAQQNEEMQFAVGEDEPADTSPSLTTPKESVTLPAPLATSEFEFDTSDSAPDASIDSLVQIAEEPPAAVSAGGLTLELGPAPAELDLNDSPVPPVSVEVEDDFSISPEDPESPSGTETQVQAAPKKEEKVRAAEPAPVALDFDVADESSAEVTSTKGPTEEPRKAPSVSGVSLDLAAEDVKPAAAPQSTSKKEATPRPTPEIEALSEKSTPPPAPKPAAKESVQTREAVPPPPPASGPLKGSDATEFDEPHEIFPRARARVKEDASGGLSKGQLSGAITLGVTGLFALNWFLTPEVKGPSLPSISLSENSQIEAPVKSGRSAVTDLRLKGVKENDATNARVEVRVLPDRLTARFSVTSPKPPELTPEEIGRGLPPHLWLKKLETDEVLLTPMPDGKLHAEVPVYIYIQQGKEKRRLAATASLEFAWTVNKQSGVMTASVVYSPSRQPPLEVPADGIALEAPSPDSFKISLKQQIPVSK